METGRGYPLTDLPTQGDDLCSAYILKRLYLHITAGVFKQREFWRLRMARKGLAGRLRE